MRKVTIHTIQRMKENGSKIVMVTAYDATFARLVEEGGVDVVLVGDSLGNVIQGNDSTLPVTMDQMVYHCQCVSRGLDRCLLVGDLPFLSYQAGIEDAIRNAGRLLKEGYCHAVKLEGGKPWIPVVERLIDAGIPVMGHLGLTPQSIHRLGGYRIQGRSEEEADRIVSDAVELERAGAFSIVLEGIPAGLAKRISAALTIPTIGIGAGIGCDGQVLVLYDLLGLDRDFQPRFLKKFETLHERTVGAVKSYTDEVRSGLFPSQEHSH